MAQGDVVLWDLRRPQQPLQSVAAHPGHCVWDVRFHPLKPAFLLSGGGDGRVLALDYGNGGAGAGGGGSLQAGLPPPSVCPVTGGDGSAAAAVLAGAGVLGLDVIDIDDERSTAVSPPPATRAMCLAVGVCLPACVDNALHCCFSLLLPPARPHVTRVGVLSVGLSPFRPLVPSAATNCGPPQVVAVYSGGSVSVLA